jgi:hypothetical protein
MRYFFFRNQRQGAEKIGANKITNEDLSAEGNYA